jgi:hypothetical protein
MSTACVSGESLYAAGNYNKQAVGFAAQAGAHTWFGSGDCDGVFIEESPNLKKTMSRKKQE